MKRRSLTLRASGLLLLAVLVAAQPQVLCGLHCMFFAGSTTMGAPSRPPVHHDHGTLCHGRAITGGRTIPVARLAAPWLPADPSPTLPASVHTSAPVGPTSAGSSVRPDPERPPPRA